MFVMFVMSSTSYVAKLKMFTVNTIDIDIYTLAVYQSMLLDITQLTIPCEPGLG